MRLTARALLEDVDHPQDFATRASQLWAVKAANSNLLVTFRG